MLQKKTYFFLMIFFAFFQANAQVLKIPFSKKENKTIEAILLQNKDLAFITVSYKEDIPLSDEEIFTKIFVAS